MDPQQIKEELENIFEIDPGAIAVVGAAAVGAAAGRGMSMLICAKKFGRGTAKYKECMKMKNTIFGKGSKAIGQAVKKGVNTLRDKK